MYRLVLYVLTGLMGVSVLLSVPGVLPYRPEAILGQAAAFAALCWGINRLLARVFRVRANPESSLISGLILAAIAGPLSLAQWEIALTMSAAAMASKYVLVWRRSHIFNPAAFGAVVSAVLLGHPASWWIGSSAVAPAMLLGGIILMAKLRRWHLVLSFFGTYLGLLTLEALLIRGWDLLQAAGLLQSVAASPVLFFAFIMLTEPLTAPQTLRRRMMFGVLVGAVLFALQRLAGVAYSLELSVLAGNVFSRLVNPDFRQAFILRRQAWLAPAIGTFWFEAARRFAFAPGQFLEYTLPHPRPDARGVRRYFSIASSPTEPNVLLAVRFSRPGSTFKQELSRLQAGDEIIASKVAGDFVLPADPAQRLAFIAGGIGITPFRSMVKYLLDKKQRRDIVLLYGARTEADFVFKDIFEAAQAAFGMQSIYVVGQPIGADTIRQAVPDLADRLWYVSGPEPMVRELARLLIGLGVSRRRIKRDYFPGY